MPMISQEQALLEIHKIGGTVLKNLSDDKSIQITFLGPDGLENEFFATSEFNYYSNGDYTIIPCH